MNFYLNLLDDQARIPGENSSVGIILCKSRDRLEVEYALRGVTTPVGVCEYLISPRLPKRLAGALPSPDQLKKVLLEPP